MEERLPFSKACVPERMWERYSCQRCKGESRRTGAGAGREEREPCSRKTLRNRQESATGEGCTATREECRFDSRGERSRCQRCMCNGGERRVIAGALPAPFTFTRQTQRNDLGGQGGGG